MPSGAAFKITYPSTIVIGTGTLSKCTVTYKSVVYIMTGCTVDSANRFIYVNTGLTATINAGDTLVITMGSLTNPIT